MPLPDHHDPKPEAGASGVGERRAQGNLRLIFEGACRITTPFFDAKQGWGNTPLTMYAQQTLRDNYPHLSQQEIAILFSAVRRFHKANTNQ